MIKSINKSHNFIYYKTTTILVHVLITIFVFLTVLFLPVFSLLIFTPFYYVHIPTYNLAGNLSSREIITAYNELIKYLLGITNDFSLGNFRYSISGMEHFYDVRQIIGIIFH